MLLELSIKNFAIIDSLHVSFLPGLNVLTGETGAGKSIIIEAVNLILGQRASSDLVRTGEEEAVVECLFGIAGYEVVRDKLVAAGMETGDELLVKRVISRSGRNRVFMNGGLSTTSLLTEILPLLVNIYGQHESQTLLRPENHSYLLDGFGGLSPLRERFHTLHQDYRKMRDELRKQEEGEKEAGNRADLLSFQRREIEGANLLRGEDEELLEERQRLVHGEKLLRSTMGAYQVLYDGEGAFLGILSGIISEIEESGKIDKALTAFPPRLNELRVQLEDIALALRDYALRIESDPSRLQQIDDRIDFLNRLKKKYATDIEGILSRREEIVRELEILMNREELRGDLEKKIRDLELKLRDAGRELSGKRSDISSKLKIAMERELGDLAMKGTLFEVEFSPYEEPRANGMERIEFLFSPNKGEEPRPLARIASGGELSRLMLALKQLHPESDVPTLIFDEVDTGIGGAVSAMVGRKLKRVAKNQQVLCITHLPQIGAFADHHFKVEKLTESGRTRTQVHLLSGEARVAELARMLGGAKVTEKTLEHAREMMEDCRTACP